MSFWKGVKNAFGFGGESEDDDEEYDSSLPTYAAQPRVMSPKPAPTATTAVTVTRDSKASESDAEAADSPSVDDNHAAGVAVKSTEDTVCDDPALPGDLFDAIIEQFNAAQPDFISRCLSIEAQRVYLLNSLSENLRARLNRAISHNGEAEATDARAAEAERQRMQRRINALEADNKNTESLRQENRKLHLSIERQKRALLDRINDLEAQVAKSHAEREKFFTDKRNPDDAALIDSSNSRISELEQQLAQKGEELEAMTARLAEQSTLREQLEVKTRMSDEMINDLRNQAAAARNEYEDTCRQQQMALDRIHDQVASFEQIKAKLESRITELKEALKEEKRADREATIARLNEENASLRHTIENNLYNQANSEGRLRSEIKQLRRELEQAKSAATAAAVTPSPAERYGDGEAIPSPDAFLAEQQPAKPAAKRRGRPKKVKLDEELDNTEWFSSQHKEDPDFGYHEPPRRPSNDNAAQLSLF